MKLATVVKVKLLDPRSDPPVVSEGNVGFDIKSIEDVKLSPGKVTKLKTGLALAASIGYGFSQAPRLLSMSSEMGLVPFFKIEGRSGLAAKGIFPVGGIVDPSYRGEICVLLFNSTEEEYVVKEKDRIAQLVCYHTLAPLEGSQVLFQVVEDVAPSDRGDKGFGSSGA